MDSLSGLVENWCRFRHNEKTKNEFEDSPLLVSVDSCDIIPCKDQLLLLLLLLCPTEAEAATSMTSMTGRGPLDPRWPSCCTASVSAPRSASASKSASAPGSASASASDLA